MRNIERPVVFTRHAREKMADRGVSQEAVIAALQIGQREPARRGLWQYRVNLQYERSWRGKHYAIQQVVPVVDEEEARFVVITVYAAYFQEGQER